MPEIKENAVIEGIDLDSVPPCGLNKPFTRIPCGNPSVYHVRPKCEDHGWLQPRFLCEHCYGKLCEGKVYCGQGNPVARHRGIFITWELL